MTKSFARRPATSTGWSTGPDASIGTLNWWPASLRFQQAYRVSTPTDYCW